MSWAWPLAIGIGIAWHRTRPKDRLTRGTTPAQRHRIATASPELARIIRPLLAHTSNRTGEVYYNRACMMAASRRHGDALGDLRQKLKLEMETSP